MNKLRQLMAQCGSASRSGGHSESFGLIFTHPDRRRPVTPVMVPLRQCPNSRNSEGPIMNVNTSDNMRNTATSTLNMQPTQPRPKGHDNRTHGVALGHGRARKSQGMSARLLGNPMFLTLLNRGEHRHKIRIPPKTAQSERVATAAAAAAHNESTP
jgi:hypothetical protein